MRCQLQGYAAAKGAGLLYEAICLHNARVALEHMQVQLLEAPPNTLTCQPGY